MAPVSVLEEWKNTAPEERQAAEKKMQAEWQAWMQEHAAMLKDGTAGVGKTARVTSAGISDTHNDIMLYSIAEAESEEDVAKAFVGHPHLGIPQASIEIMPVNHLPGM